MNPAPSKGSSCSPGRPCSVEVARAAGTRSPGRHRRSAAAAPASPPGARRSSENATVGEDAARPAPPCPGVSTATSTARTRWAKVPGCAASRSSSVSVKVQRPVAFSCPKASGRSRASEYVRVSGNGHARRPEPHRLELGEVEGQPVDAADVAHARVEVTDPDHADRRRELVGQGPLGEPRRPGRPGRGSGAATGARRRRARPRSRG